MPCTTRMSTPRATAPRRRPRRSAGPRHRHRSTTTRRWSSPSNWRFRSAPQPKVEVEAAGALELLERLPASKPSTRPQSRPSAAACLESALWPSTGSRPGCGHDRRPHRSPASSSSSGPGVKVARVDQPPQGHRLRDGLARRPHPRPDPRPQAIGVEVPNVAQLVTRRRHPVARRGRAATHPLEVASVATSPARR